MRFKTTWVLLILAAVAASYFFFVEQPRHAREENAELETQRLSTVEPDRVGAVRIERADGIFEFELVGDGWYSRLPVADLMEDAKINTLVRSLTDARIERRVTDNGEFGLEEPSAVVTLITDTEAFTAIIGNLTLTKTHCYLTRPGLDNAGVVLMAPAGIRRYATRTLYDFRDKRILRVDADQVSRFTVASDDRQLACLRSNDGLWLTVADGDTLPGDTSEVEAIVRELRGLRATEILARDDEGLARQGGTVGTVTIEPLDSPALVIAFGERNDNSTYIAVAGRDRVSRVNASVLHIFEKDIDDLRDRRLARFGLSKARAIAIKSDRGATSIVNNGDEWTFANPTLGTIDQEAVLDFVTVLQNLRFREILDDSVPAAKTFNAEQASFRVTVTDAQGAVLDEFMAGDNQQPGSLRYAFSRGLDRWGIIDEEPLEDLLRRFEAFRTQ